MICVTVKLSLRLKEENTCMGYQTERESGLKTGVCIGNACESCL